MNKAFEKILEFIDEQIKIEESIAKSENEGHPITHQYGANCMNVIKKFIQEVAEEYNGGWIACSDWLPELDGTYICTCQGISESITLIFSTHDNSWNDEFEAEYDDVIAWQPLPEPYKAESEDK